jgi:predicted NBD/HSP70 family sugar kinase
MYVGARALAGQAARRFEPGALGSVAEIVRRARLGDATARAIVHDTGHNLGIVIAGVLNLLNPHVVVLGGEVTGVGDVLLDSLRREVQRRTLASVFAQTRLVLSHLGAQSVAVGAATLVLQKALADKRLFTTPSQASA